MPVPIKVPKYCTFWIPSVAHNDFQIIEEIVESPIIKGKNNSSYQINSVITKTKSNAFSIRLTITETSSSGVNSQYHVELSSVDYCISGLLEFEYSLSQHYHSRFKRVIHHAYRLIVRHFHRHIYHHPDKEGVRLPFTSDKLCRLDVEDNDALVFYLKQVHELISEQVDMIHDMSPAYNENESELSKDDLDKRRKEMEMFYGKCENLRGQMPFFHSLLNSPFNKSCRVFSPVPTNDLQKELHTIAHNIVNLSNSIQNLFEKSKTVFYIRNINTSFDIQSNIKDIATENKMLISAVQKSNKVSSRLGKQSFWISVIMGIISIGLGAISIYMGLDKSLDKDSVNAVAKEVVKILDKKELDKAKKGSVFTVPRNNDSKRNLKKST